MVTATVWLLNFGSGRISLAATTRLLGISKTFHFLQGYLEHNVQPYLHLERLTTYNK